MSQTLLICFTIHIKFVSIALATTNSLFVTDDVAILICIRSDMAFTAADRHFHNRTTGRSPLKYAAFIFSPQET